VGARRGERASRERSSAYSPLILPWKGKDYPSFFGRLDVLLTMLSIRKRYEDRYAPSCESKLNDWNHTTATCDQRARFATYSDANMQHGQAGHTTIDSKSTPPRYNLHARRRSRHCLEIADGEQLLCLPSDRSAADSLPGAEFMSCGRIQIFISRSC
jgi:hypothetical protein